MPTDVDLSPVWKAWNVIDTQFVPAAVASSTPLATSTQIRHEKEVWGLISGMTAALNDPYSFFLPPVEKTAFAQALSGAFEGVGMEIAVRNQIITVVSPLRGTPAERAGIKAGDQVLKIDDVSTQGMDVSDAVKRIRGTKGTVVRLLIMRDTYTAPKELKVTRDVINVPIVTPTQRKDGVYVIQIASFTANSADLFRTALREFMQTGGDKLVIDLRGNPGGYLDAAVEIGSWFTSSGSTIVTEDYAGHATNIVHRSLGYNVFDGKGLKMVILVDRGSASASEILADAMRNYGIAKLVGTNTFGKGSVQELVPITPETSLKLTVARWLGPDGSQIPLTGIAPDFQVPISDDDIKAGHDPQMAKAVELLTGIKAPVSTSTAATSTPAQ
jgi:carboxyl-terminal processing protease